MEPHMSQNDKRIFYKYLDNANYYFEYGSGGSTYQASIRNNIKKIYSVESDLMWHNLLKQKIQTDNISYIYNDMNTKPNNWGHPGKDATDNQKINYSEQIKHLHPDEQNAIDFILIDGRFRVACCLKCYNIINNNCLIAFDDFIGRKYYHIVLDYFEIIEKSKDNNSVGRIDHLVILKKKPNLNIPEPIIKKYELICD
jgi:hypothetical protein